ncbi:hypothetical protein ACULNC_17335 [Shigella flexneri]
MTTPNPLAKTKGAGRRSGCIPATAMRLRTLCRTLTGCACDGEGLATCEMTADAEDDTYLDDEDADWKPQPRAAIRW